jgi:hypothetical protein
MNDHGMPLAAIQESLDCQRATVIATINQTRKRKDDVSKDYEAVQNYVGFVKQFPPETGGLPVRVLSPNAHHDVKIIYVH